ncbi:hypothetical protein FOZ62_027236 [Perkinsus olseni]|uniref:Uncharacterized protein n=1 Tax=Perkinsus olseni TaxID=32597 RepID=A0A7J6PSN5_PEROL|nr:hypothetical protein FOZ62_027236 [Perkinsus olseni]
MTGSLESQDSYCSSSSNGPSFPGYFYSSIAADEATGDNANAIVVHDIESEHYRMLVGPTRGKVFRLFNRIRARGRDASLADGAEDIVLGLICPLYNLGLVEDVTAGELDLSVVLRSLTGLSGEVATRSRVPILFRLARNLVIRFRWENDRALKVIFEGFGYTPLDGVREAISQITPRGLSPPFPTQDEAWDWFKSGDCDEVYPPWDFKFTKIVHSLWDNKLARLAMSTSDWSQMFWAILCVIPARIESITITPGTPDNMEPQARAKMVRLDQGDPLGDYLSQEEDQLAVIVLKTPTKRALAEKYAASGTNWCALVQPAKTAFEQQLRGADPHRIAKLLAGAAAPSETVLAPTDWRDSDPTWNFVDDKDWMGYVLKEHGRVLWRPAPGYGEFADPSLFYSDEDAFSGTEEGSA